MLPLGGPFGSSVFFSAALIKLQSTPLHENLVESIEIFRMITPASFLNIKHFGTEHGSYTHMLTDDQPLTVLFSVLA